MTSPAESTPPPPGARRIAAELGKDPLTWLCAPLVLAAAAIAFVNLGTTPFWVDESIAVMPARSVRVDLRPTSPFDHDFMPWQIKYGLWDPATPLYRYTLGAFTALTGFSELTTRTFSLLLGFAAAVPLFALARRLYGPRTALLGVTFWIAWPTFMIFAREARHYTFVIFLALCTLYYLYRAAEEDEGPAHGLWFVFLVATLLSQTLGYALLPIVFFYALAVGPQRLFRRRCLPYYAAAGAVYVAVMAVFWDTLPFFHATECGNRPEGCNHSLTHYVWVLYSFLQPLPFRFEWIWVKTLSLPPFLFAAGLLLSVWRSRRMPTRWSWLVPLWLLVPFVLLSSREVKFPRYLFMWIGPLCALLPAYAVDIVSRLPRLGKAGAPVGALLVLLVVLSPGFALEEWPHRLSLRSGMADYVEHQILGAPEDNWERMRYQADLLRPRLQPGDVVVTSFDDSSLQYYLDQFVYSMLNSTRSDAFLNELVDRAERRGTKVYFVDTLPKYNWCLTNEPEPRSIDCRVKFERFYQRCLTVRACGGPEPACVHVPVD